MIANPASFVRRISHGRSKTAPAGIKQNLRSRSNSVRSIKSIDSDKITLLPRRSLSRIVVKKLRRTSQRDPPATPQTIETIDERGNRKTFKEVPDQTGATECNQATGTPNVRRKSSVGDFVLAAKTRVHSLVKRHEAGGKSHGSQLEIALRVSTTPVFTDQYTLDLPISISPDKSELDFLRRTNLEGTTDE